MGHCDQQLYRFLKLIPLLHISLVTQGFHQWWKFSRCVWRVNRVGSEPPCSEASFFSNLLWGAFWCPWLSKKWKSQKKVKINKTVIAADNRPQAANKKCGQSASSSWDHSQYIIGVKMDFPNLKTKTSNQLFRSKLTSRACKLSAWLVSCLANRD